MYNYYSLFLMIQLKLLTYKFSPIYPCLWYAISMLPGVISSMLLIILKKNWGGRVRKSDRRRKEEGSWELSAPQAGRRMFLVWIPFSPFGLGFAWGHFCMFANNVCFLVLPVSFHNIPKY